MIRTFDLFPGIRLRCCPDNRFKHGCMSIQLVRPMCRKEAAENALLPAVLLRGCRSCPDLRDITLRLDELYGASIGALVRRVGDYQTTGFYASFMEDRFAMGEDEILAPLTAFLKELLLDPILEEGVFRQDYVISEKKNLISTIESQRNDKRAYAMEQMLSRMCSNDSFGIPRLGEIPLVERITPESLYRHYRRILQESRIDLFYVGAAEPETVIRLVTDLFAGLERAYCPLPQQTAFGGGEQGEWEEEMEVSQGKLCMGFVTPVTIRDADFVPMQLLNLVFGGGMTSKLFMNIRERESLCYAIGSGYHSAKGILTVSAGIDSQMGQTVREQVLAQLEACRAGEISQEELVAAKKALYSSLQATHDSPGSIEHYYATAALSGLRLSPMEYMDAAEQVTLQQLADAAQTLRLHSVFFLKGVAE